MYYRNRKIQDVSFENRITGDISILKTLKLLRHYIMIFVLFQPFTIFFMEQRKNNRMSQENYWMYIYAHAYIIGFDVVTKTI